MPPAFTVDLSDELGLLERTRQGGRFIYEATEIADPLEFSVFLFGRNDDGLQSEVVDAGDAVVTVSSWPDDPAWRSHVRDAVDQGIPKLEELTGLSWPEELNLEIIETVTRYLYGYGGWYNDGLGLIEIGEDLNDRLIYHELSHIWFNSNLFAERWITEGLAELYAQATLDAIGRGTDESTEFEALSKPNEPRLTLAEALPVSERKAPPCSTDANTERTEDYGYNAAWYVMDELAAEIGVDGVTAILDAVAAGEISYPAEGQAESGAGDSWRRFLDLAEFRGNSTDVQDLFRGYVLTNDQITELDTRNTALALYKSFVEQSGDWPVPAGLRFQMHQWSFGAVEQFVRDGGILLEMRDAVQAKANDLGLAVPTDIRDDYVVLDRFPQFAELQLRARAQLDALVVVEHAETLAAGEYDFWTRWGLRGEDLDADFADVRAAFEGNRFDDVASESAEIDQLLADAPREARRFWTKMAIIAGTGLLIVIASVTWLLMRRRRRKQRQQSSVELGVQPIETANNLGEGPLQAVNEPLATGADFGPGGVGISRGEEPGLAQTPRLSSHPTTVCNHGASSAGPAD